MSSDPRTRGMHETCHQRGPQPATAQAGGGPNYLEKSLAAAAEPFKGITTVRPRYSRVVRHPAKRGFDPVDSRSSRGISRGVEHRADAKTIFAVETDQWRKWSNIHPTLMRHGTALFEMTDQQRDCAFALLRESLSQRGFEETLDLMHFNETVLELTGRLSEYGEDLYWLSIMGTPSATEPWGWQWDGHHLIINYFILGDRSS